MSKSSGRKRTKAQRDAHLEKIASMHFRGLRQKEIAEKFGLTQAQISHDLKEIYKRMPLVDRPKSDRYRKRNLGELAEIKRECWDAWARSKQNKEVQIQEKSTKEYKGCWVVSAFISSCLGDTSTVPRSCLGFHGDSRCS